MDTNVLSEIRRGEKSDKNVREWLEKYAACRQYVSVITLGEIRRGIERRRLNDPVQAANLDRWLDRVSAQFRSRILEVGPEEADRWGRLSPSQPLPEADGLLAATALEHDLVIVTRNEVDFLRAGVPVINPWKYRD